MMNTLEKINPQDMKNMVTFFPDLLNVIDISPQIKSVLKDFRAEEIKGICYVGMGGSSIAGSYTQYYLSDKLKIPLHVVRNYSLPKYVDNKWIVILTSYSGNTEETISSLRDAMDRNLRTICISSDGKITEIGRNVVAIPGKIQPRAAFPLLFSTVLTITELALSEKNTDFSKVSDFLKGQAKLWGKVFPEPIEVASLFHHKIPLYIASGYLVPVAYRAKCQTNENSKHPAFYSELPEANHNEIEGFADSIAKEILPIFLRGNYERSEILKRIDITYDLYKDMGLNPLVLKIDDAEQLEEMLTLTHYLDMVSVELAFLDKANPVSVDRISELKQRMSQS